MCDDGKKGKNLFILFYYKWCHTCQEHYPFFRDSWKDVMSQYPGDVQFFKVDLDNRGDLLRYFKVTKSPTFAYMGTGGPGK